MAGRALLKANVTRCPHVKADGNDCGHVTPKGWDYCVVHAEARGAEILREVPLEERVEVVVRLPKLVARLGGLKRSEWEAVRLELCGVPVDGFGGGANASQ